MKYWRTLAVATVALFAAVTAFAAMAPKAPAAAGPAVSCMKNTETAPVFPLTMPVGRIDTTSTGVGNGFPWENSTFFFSSFRNQYLYPSSAVNAVAGVSATIDSIHARSTSFTGANNSIYGDFRNGDPSFIRVTDSVSSGLSTTFAVNPLPGTTFCAIDSSTGPFEIDTFKGPGGAVISSCNTCATDPACPDPDKADCWCAPGDANPGTRTYSHILLDHVAQVVGGSGYGVWDTSQGMDGAQRAYGSGSFANPNYLTTALNVDTYDFVWVFSGVGLPPAATVEQQIAEIIRLLLTPQGLRCSGLDMNPGDGMIEDTPITFPMGKGIDPIMPQVTTGGTITGDELKDDLRGAGWKP